MNMPDEDTIEVPRPNAEMEYVSLREEVLKRIESRQQLISIALTIAGAFLGVGWGAGAVVLLLYPLIATLLAAAWAQNEVLIEQLNSYIRDHLEAHIANPGWASYSRKRRAETMIFGWPIDVLAVGGIFVLTQLMALALGWTQFGWSFLEWLLLAADGLAVLIVLWLLHMIRRRITND